MLGKNVNTYATNVKKMLEMRRRRTARKKGGEGRECWSFSFHAYFALADWITGERHREWQE